MPVLPEEPADGCQDREWNHDRPEDDEGRRLIAGGGNNIRSSPHEVILHRCWRREAFAAYFPRGAQVAAWTCSVSALIFLVRAWICSVRSVFFWSKSV